MTTQNLEELSGHLLHDLGGAFGVPLVRIGKELGIYAALKRRGPMTSAELAGETGLLERYLREWLSYHAASSYVDYDPATETFSLSDAQCAIFADVDGPAYMVPAFDAAAAYLGNQDLVSEAFRTGRGVGWGNQSGCLFCAVADFFRPGYKANLVESWLPALDGLVEKLQRGARVADVGCGHGHSTIIMAEAFPNSEFIGFDFHAPSIDEANGHARRHGLHNLRFETGKAADYPGADYDLVTFFDCLHDMGDPAGAAAHVRETLKPDGRWMIVEPMASDTLTENLNPVSRLYYAASTMVCVPTSLDQEVGTALGAQAGEARLRDVVCRGGFSSCAKVAETPFNLILEATP